MATYFYADESREPIGPFSASELLDLSRKGTITPRTFVIEDGSKDWRRWSEFSSVLERTSSVSKSAAVLPTAPVTALAPAANPRGGSRGRCENKVVRVSLSSGILGTMLTNPRSAVESAIAEQNAQGWRFVQMVDHSDTNLLMSVLKLVVLCCTLFLWTWSSAYLIVFEREME